MLTTRRTLAPAAAVLAALLLLLTACGGDKDVPPPGPLEDYVALGDSYAAGPGINPVKDENCKRSDANYATLIAADLKLTDFEDMTCGGANTGNLIKPQEKNGAEINPPQLDAVTATTDLVTLGIGLNDSGLSGEVLFLCLPQFQLEKECAKYLAEPESAIITDVAGITSHIKLAIDAIRTNAPSTRIVLIGYPRALPDASECPDLLPLTGEAADRLRLTLKAADLGYAKLAKEEKVKYVSMYDASIGHDICSADPWVNGITDHSKTGQGAPLHPTPAYMRAVADRVVALYRK